MRSEVSAGILVPGSSRVARPQVRGVAIAVGFYLSFRLCIVLLCVRLLGLEPGTGSALNIGLDLLLLGLVAFDSAGASRRPLAALLRMPAIPWLLAYLALCGISLVWSETASLEDSVAYWLGLAVDVATVVLLLRGETAIEDAHALLKGFVWSTCLLAAMAWIMPTQQDLRLGDEQFFNTNEIGNLCAFGLLFAQYLTRSRGENWRFAKFFLAVTLIRSLSKTTLVAFLVCEAILFILDKSMTRKTRILLISAALLLILAFWGLFEAYYDVYTTAGNQAETLTGRTAIWLYVFNAVFDHPWSLWIGHGFDSWWKVVPPFGNELFEARHAENEILQQFYAYGAVGVVLLAGIYGSLFRQLRRLKAGPTKLLFLCLLIFIVTRGLAEADAFDLLLPLWLIVLICILADGEMAQGAESLASG